MLPKTGAFKESLRRRIFKLNFGLKPRHRERFRSISAADQAAFAEFMRRTYTNTSDESSLEAETAARMDEDRHVIMPWIDAALPLEGARVLEIGCGTGESTVALGEQGARVTGLDVDANALAIGRERCRVYGVEAEFIVGNVTQVDTLLAGRQFDIVIFFASLEHMTLDEKLSAMQSTWAMLRPGGIWCVIEAPNRLWFWDGHSSFENFYNWLPDDVAWRWARQARREAFAGAFSRDTGLDPVLLARWGRGVSFHEFDIVFGDAKKLDVVSNKRDFLSRHNPLFAMHRLFSKARRYERFLERLEPAVNPGFFRQYMDLIIRKPGA